MTQVIIDVREPEEYNRGHVKGAINMPPNELVAGAEKVRDLPRDAELILYCVSGSRSNASMSYLRQLGFTNIVNGINQQHVEKNYM